MDSLNNMAHYYSQKLYDLAADLRADGIPPIANIRDIDFIKDWLMDSFEISPAEAGPLASAMTHNIIIKHL